MLGILVLIVVVPVIVAIAKGRGASPWLAGSLALGGHFVIPILIVVVFGRSESTLLVAMVLSYAWLAALAGCYRFVVGARRPQPTGMWSCKNCTYTNRDNALACSACGQAWQPPAPT